MSERALLKDLIRIPERVHQGDFVLKLTEGVEAADATVRDYVVTPQLRRCFDEALAFIQGAIEGRSSKACYLHGSFGAGKSHFMAVLNLLLAGNVRARSIPELADVVARHNTWTEGRRFLMVPYHMVGAHDMESAILGQYAEHVRRVRPDAPVPGFYLAESLFDDARGLRAQMGDEAFFGRLNEGRAEGGDGWGALESGWDAASFESAMLEPPRGEERQRLVGDLIERFFASYGRVAAGQREAFVSLDEGLSIMSGHARRLGYDAVVLFLDELILWLATRAADVNFVASEGQKLVKLVEAQLSDRPIPLVSFVARQRDLRDLVGDNLAGALQLQFADVLKHWEARFHRITLEDRNLPVIARKRLLNPVSDTARLTLDAAFEEFAGRRQDVLETLLGSTGERAMFRQVYPFSPALVQTLIAVSSLLQRERTALKLMLQLLVERREELELGMVIPVGDLWDVIAEGDEPFTEGTRLQFENAKKLWTQKLLPLLERHHGVSWQDLQEGTADPQAALGLRNDARLLKTLLLAALVPEVESLKALTPPRLAALNHGSVSSPLARREGGTVLTKLRQWAAEVGEIKITEDANPVVTVQITGVDTEPILANARQYDNEGNRRRKIREMLFQELGITEGDGFLNDYTFIWRGTRRQVDVVHDNIFELADDRLRGRGGTWTVVLGVPFDPRHTPADTRARLDSFGERAETVAWLPSHLSDKAQRELGTLVLLDYLLTGERFDDAARHLSASDRTQARALLRNQQSQLQQRLRNCLEVAYGIADQPKDAVATPLDPTDHLRSLDGTFEPQVPVGAGLGDAFQRLLDQLFAYRFPAHPQFDQEIRPIHLRKVHEVLQEAIADPEHRIFVADRATRQLVSTIANPLNLGTVGATHFVLGHYWPSHLARLHGQHGGAMTVKRLREWTDDPRPMGLTREVQNLIIFTYAEQANRSFFHHGVAVRPTLDRLDDELELREQALPPADAWVRARERAAALFGLTPPEVLNAANVDRLVAALLAPARAAAGPLARLVRTLEAQLVAYRGEAQDADRLVTARSAMALLAEAEAAGDGSKVVEALARAAVRKSEAAMARTLATAAELEAFLAGFDWQSLEALHRIQDHRRAAADAIRGQLAEALTVDEHVTALRPALDQARAKALRLLAEAPPPVPPPPPPPGDGIEEVAAEAHSDLPATEALAVLAELERRLEAEPDGHLSIQWRLTRRTRGE